MTKSELIYYVGLAIYSFEDFLSKGSELASMVALLEGLFPSFPLTLYEAVTVSEQEREPVVESRRTDRNKLVQGIKDGKISRFHARDDENSLKAKVAVWAKLDLTRRHPERPNHFLLRLPMDYFLEYVEQAAQDLLIFGKKAFEQLDGAYGYAGVRVTGQSSDAINQVINESIGSIPVGDFMDINIETEFQDHVKGAFWANFLSDRHVDALGGLDRVIQTAPYYKVERLGDGGLLLVLSPSPIPTDQNEEAALYAHLRKYLGPITVSRTPNISPALEKTGRVFRKSYNT